LVVLPIRAEVDISTLANLINAIAVTAGVIFAATQIQYYRQRRRRDAMLELVRSFQSPAFPSDAVYLVALTWESIGVLLFRRELTLDLIDDFFSGPIVLSWKKLQVYSDEWRRTLDRETFSEWFHWLAERMMEREKLAPPVPAYIAHRRWREARRR